MCIILHIPYTFTVKHKVNMINSTLETVIHCYAGRSYFTYFQAIKYLNLLHFMHDKICIFVVRRLRCRQSNNRSSISRRGSRSRTASSYTSCVNHNYDRKILYNSKHYIAHVVLYIYHCGYVFCSSNVLPTQPERGAQIKFTCTYKTIKSMQYIVMFL